MCPSIKQPARPPPGRPRRSDRNGISGTDHRDPVSGERITFRRTGADTGGELLAFDLELQPDGTVPGKHVHPSQEERFTVVSGRMKFRKGLRTVIAEAGDVVVVPAGTPHKFENAGDEVAHVQVEVRPALNMEQLLRTAVRLAEEGAPFAAGCPSRSTSRSSRGEYRDEVRGAFRPRGCSRPPWPRWPASAEWRGRAAIYAERPATA